jgi:para-aminobenzoate synthetase component 1
MRLVFNQRLPMKKREIWVRDLPYHADSGHWFEKVRCLPYPVYLQSADLKGVDIISAAPVVSIITHGKITCITDASGCRESTQDPFQILQKILVDGSNPVVASDEQPMFEGGAIGYFGYDLGRRIEQLPGTPVADISLPDMAVGIYLWSVESDHSKKTSKLYISPDCPGQLREQIIDCLDSTEDHRFKAFNLESSLVSNFSRETYRDAFNRIKQYIDSGDCYQVNLAQRFSGKFCGDSWDLYSNVSKELQAPFSAYLSSDDWSVLSFSPERFLSLDNRTVTAQPIKGTRPRSSDAGEDERLANELLNSDKDQAENLMIVDLLRNDLGKSCAPGSIQTPALFRLERFKNVHHLVSDITGHLADTKESTDLLRGCFPGGSITGAPKIRAMQIIDELEPQRRSVYCGCIGYLGFNDTMDMNIAIRTLVCDADQIYCWGGGGIVADSEWQMEYEETFHKIDILLLAMERSITH